MARKNPDKALEIKENVESWYNLWKDNTDTYNMFNEFVWGNQWADNEVKVLEDYRKIPLTMNKVAPLLNHLVGEQRQNTPSIEVIAEDDIPVDTVEAREALVKEIVFESNAKTVYQ